MNEKENLWPRTKKNSSSAQNEQKSVANAMNVLQACIFKPVKEQAYF